MAALTESKRASDYGRTQYALDRAQGSEYRATTFSELHGFGVWGRIWPRNLVSVGVLSRGFRQLVLPEVYEQAVPQTIQMFTYTSQHARNHPYRRGC